ncbi:NAD-binding protein [Phellopilus nigrolimitatus]|nr:NAD-binding protein [Phellopilus nigrolimitatus]
MYAIRSSQHGISGAGAYTVFIALWLVQDLLERGYSVRAESKAAHIRSLFKAYADKLEIVEVLDITQPGAFNVAVQGVDAIAHTASPFHFSADDPNELIGPPGPQLQHITVLSSGAAVAGSSDHGELHERTGSSTMHGELHERMWNEESAAEVHERGRTASQSAKYRASKALAEKGTWDFVEQHKSEISWDLVALNPPIVFDPILHEVASPAALNSSVALFYEAILTQKKTPEELAKVQVSWNDVHNVSLGHVRALEVPAAGGQRFILTASVFIWQDWCTCFPV